MRRKKLNPGQALTARPSPDDFLRFFAFVVVEQLLPLNHAVKGPCWRWTGATDDKGYGSFWFAGKRRWSHRVSLWFFRGESLADGREGDHECHNHSCVNPFHLTSKTKVENSAIKPWHDRSAYPASDNVPEHELPDPAALAAIASDDVELPI